MKTCLGLLLVFFLSACFRDPIGTECIRKGDGFTARHNCKTTCLSIWTITCPDGSVGNSNVCAGEEGCTRGSCKDGQVCYQTNFDRAFCVPESICPGWEAPENHPSVVIKTFRPSPPLQTMATTAPAPPLPPIVKDK